MEPRRHVPQFPQGPSPVPADELTPLLKLRALTQRNHMLYEAQIVQLRLYPHAAAPWAEDSTLRVDIPKKEIVYDLGVKARVSKGRQTAAVKLLRAWIAVLLGGDWSVEMNVKKRVAASD